MRPTLAPLSPEVPEIAIAAWEKAHQLHVAVHDLRGSLWPFMAPDRFHHSSTLCQTVKRMGRDRMCAQFSAHRLRREIGGQPHGRVQVCHAGFVEWAVPVFDGEELEWVVFAGQRTAGPGLTRADWDEVRPLPESFWSAAVPKPAPVDDEEAALILEHLRQLTARLRLWRRETETEAANPAESIVPSSPLVLRRIQIQRFIATHHTEPLRLKDLATRLALSEWRTSHVVRECCGSSFQELLTEARLRTAMGLLRHSDLPVADIAIRSGFDEVRQFHRVFKRHMNLSPLQYRKAARA